MSNRGNILEVMMAFSIITETGFIHSTFIHWGSCMSSAFCWLLQIKLLKSRGKAPAIKVIIGVGSLATKYTIAIDCNHWKKKKIGCRSTEKEQRGLAKGDLTQGEITSRMRPKGRDEVAQVKGKTGRWTSWRGNKTVKQQWGFQFRAYKVRKDRTSKDEI